MHKSLKLSLCLCLECGTQLVIGNGHNFQGRQISPSLLNRVYSKGKEIAPLGSKYGVIVQGPFVFAVSKCKVQGPFVFAVSKCKVWVVFSSAVFEENDEVLS